MSEYYPNYQRSLGLTITLCACGHLIVWKKEAPKPSMELALTRSAIE
jgi:hypothetical protein